jgi:DNA modification methylase
VSDPTVISDSAEGGEAMRREPFLSDPDVTLWNGDSLDVLREMPDGSVDMIATSPPFY